MGIYDGGYLKLMRREERYDIAHNMCLKSIYI